MLEVTGLVKAYGPVRALDGVSFSIGRGVVVALLGSNGAGKTTTLKCILGVTDFKGGVEVDGLAVKKHGKAVRRRIGYLAQSAAFGERDTCWQTLEFLADLKGVERQRIWDLLELVNLPGHANTRVSHLSGGMRQRLALAAALLADPPVLLLDEPTASLDADSRRELHKLILRLRDQGKTVLLSTHFFDRLGELADRIILLCEGRVALDEATSELRSRSAGNRYVVDTNGTPPAAFLEALRSAGIGPEQVRTIDANWDELVQERSTVGSPDEIGGGLK
jgi:ABC-type multidrug transport system ATPase subunit